MTAPIRFAAEATPQEAAFGPDLDYARKEILNVLQDHPNGCQLSDVISELTSRLPVPTISAILTDLINGGQIDLASDRRLRWVGTDH